MAKRGNTSFRTSFDGLPSDLILTGDKNGDGLPELVVKTADVWPKVAATLSETDILEAKEWFVSTIAVRDALRVQVREREQQLTGRSAPPLAWRREPRRSIDVARAPGLDHDLAAVAAQQHSVLHADQIGEPADRRRARRRP